MVRDRATRDDATPPHGTGPELDSPGRNVSTMEDFQEANRRGPIAWTVIMLLVGALGIALFTFAM